MCKEGQVPAGPINSIADIFEDAQFAARENLIKVQDPRIGELVLPNAMPRLSETPAAFVSTGPALGASTEDILSRLLGVTPEALQALKASKVI
ncbi:formyl-coenzyme A transferase [compost metagenome]